MIKIDKNLKFDHYSKHYKQIELVDRQNQIHTINITGWLEDLIKEVKEQGRQEYKREIHALLGIIS